MKTARPPNSRARRSQYSPAERGCPTKFSLKLRLGAGCTEEQIERLRVIAAKCPVHRTLTSKIDIETVLDPA